MGGAGRIGQKGRLEGNAGKGARGEPRPAIEFRSSALGEGQEDRLQPPRRTLESAASKQDDEPPKIVAAGLATPGADVEKKRKADADATSPGKNKKAKAQMKMSGKTGFELDAT